MYQAGLFILSTLLLSGCSYIPWLSSEEDPHPPTELGELVPEIKVNTLWSHQVGKGTDKRRLALVPALNGGRLYVADAKGLVAALNASDGRVLWERQTDLPLSGGPDVDAKYLVLGSSDGDLLALSTADGAELWRARLGGEILSVPRIAGDAVVVHTLDGNIYAFDLATGKERWKYSYQAPVLILRGSSTPLVAGQSVVVGVSGGKLVKLDLASGMPLWEVTVSPPRGRSELERIADIVADPLLVEDTIYLAAYNGDLAAVELEGGTVRWRRTLSAYAGLTVAGDRLYVTDSDDNVWEAQPSDGTGTWKQEGLKYRRLSAPAAIGDLVVVGDIEGNLHWLARQDGRIVARGEVAGGPITARPLVADGRVYVYGDDGTVAALSPGGTPARTPQPAPSQEQARPAAPPAAGAQAPRP